MSKKKHWFFLQHTEVCGMAVKPLYATPAEHVKHGGQPFMIASQAASGR